MRRWLHCVCVVGILESAAAPSAAEPRYLAVFANGARVPGGEITDWHDPNTAPKIEGKPLFDEAAPIRWIQDQTLAPAEVPLAFVEFFGGDRLPGRVTTALQGTERPFQRQWPELLVEPHVGIDWPESPRARGLPVALRWVRRVVWQRREDARYHPSTLFYRDGRHIEFRAARWSGATVRLLLEQGTRDVPFDDIAELHMPRGVGWHLWLEQLAVLCPTLEGWLLQSETSDGLRVTTSRDRLRAVSRSGGDPTLWYQMVQPAWSSEPLWIRHRTVRVRRLFMPTEWPLTVLEPIVNVQRSSLGGGWPAQIDRNDQGQPLRAQDATFGWGWGVHAFSELHFELPPAARGFRTRAALDRTAGRGGCVKASVHLNTAASAPLFESPFLIGSKEPLDSGRLQLPTSAEPARQLVLLVDPAALDHPAGSDPLEIRDSFDWLEPLLELDRAELQAGINEVLAKVLPAWQDWALTDGDSTAFRLANRFDSRDRRPPSYLLDVTPTGPFYTLSRSIKLGPDQHWLALAVHRPPESKPAWIQVRANGKVVGTFEAPVRQQHADPAALVANLQPWAGQTVSLDVTAISNKESPPLTWKGIAPVEHDPVVVQLLDDEPALVAQWVGTAVPRLDEADRFAGSASVKITPGETGAAQLEGWSFPIREQPNVGEYRFIRFAWKKAGGAGMVLYLAHEGQFSPRDPRRARDSFQLMAGTLGKEYQGGHVVQGHVPQQWEVVTRDLYSDFGAFTLTGMKLECVGGETAGLDWLILVRSPEDFERLPDPRSPRPDLRENWPPEQRANMLVLTREPRKMADAVRDFSSELPLAVSSIEVGLWKEYRGRPQVLQTHPFDQNRPAIIRVPLHLPTSPRHLKFSVSHIPPADWQLGVNVNGERVFDSKVSAATSKEGWLDVAINLEKWAGKPVLLELLNEADAWNAENGFWRAFRLEAAP